MADKLCRSWILRSLIAASSLTFITFGWLLPTICQTWVYSVYFYGNKQDPKFVKQVIDQNDLRLQNTKDFFKQVNAAQVDKYSKISGELNVDLVIGVITINRDDATVGHLGFLTQTAGRLLSSLDRQELNEFRNIKVFLCNVDSKPWKHAEASEMGQFFDLISNFHNGTTEKKLYTNNAFEKEKDDYIFCLEKAAEYNPKYVMLLEDDVLLDEDWLVTLDHLVTLRLQKDVDVYSVAKFVEVRNDWLLIKLYYPQKWMGYSNEMESIAELLGIATVGGCLTAAACYLAQTSSRKLNVTFIVIAFCWGAVYSTAVAYTVGRPYMRSWRGYYPSWHRLVPAPDCCTQGVVYSAGAIPDLCRYLKLVRCDADFAVDLAIDRYAVDYDFRRFLVDPNICRHIGFVSTVRGKLAAEFLF